MNLFKRHILDFLQAFICSGIGGLIYSIYAGTEFNFVFNVILGVVMGLALSGRRLRASRLPKSRAAQSNVEAN